MYPQEHTAATDDLNRSDATEAGTQSSETRSSNDSDDTRPSPDAMPQLTFYSRSNLFYWWPAWVVGFVFAAISYLLGSPVEFDEFRSEWVFPGAGLGVTFTLFLVLMIFFTTVKMRGIVSVLFITAAAFVVALVAWLGWWDDIAGTIPYTSVHMSAGFYFWFSVALFIPWALTFFVFDRTVFWRVIPGQLTEEHVIGGAERSFDTRGMLFEQRSDDLIRHRVLGFGAGDLALTTSGAKPTTLQIPNVLFVERKIDRIQKLIAVQPDDFKSG